MSYGPHQMKMLQDRRQKTSSRTQEFFKQSTHKVYSGKVKKLHSVEVTESLLFDIRRRLKKEHKMRMKKIVVFTTIVLILILTVIFIYL